MQSVAVIGAKGFVGSKVCEFIKNKSELKLISVVRGDSIKDAIFKADTVIHAANPSKRFYAHKNPKVDYIESVEKTKLILRYTKKKKLILISSISARTEQDTVYGSNRRDCELIAEASNALIVRLGPMFGKGKSLGALSDLLNNNNVYVSSQTKYAYVNIEYNAQKIVSFINDASLNGYIELGAKDGISLARLKKIIGSKSQFIGKDDTQIPVQPPSDAPDVMKVVDYLKSIDAIKKSE
jgi:nucleoside-diphosphate-sugar epimerase